MQAQVHLLGLPGSGLSTFAALLPSAYSTDGWKVTGPASTVESLATLRETMVRERRLPLSWPQGWPQDYDFRLSKEVDPPGQWIECRMVRLTESNALAMAHELTDGGGNPEHRPTDGVVLLFGVDADEERKAEHSRILRTLLPAIQLEKGRRSHRAPREALGVVICLTKCDLYPSFLRDRWVFGDRARSPGGLVELIGGGAAAQLESLMSDYSHARPVYATSAVGFLIDDETGQPLKHGEAHVSQLGPEGLLQPERIEPVGFDLPVRRLLAPLGAGRTGSHQAIPPPAGVSARGSGVGQTVLYFTLTSTLLGSTVAAASWLAARSRQVSPVETPAACSAVSGEGLDPRELRQSFQGFLSDRGAGREHFRLELDVPGQAEGRAVRYPFRLQRGNPLLGQDGVAHLDLSSCVLTVSEDTRFRVTRHSSDEIGLTGLGNLTGNLRPNSNL